MKKEANKINSTEDRCHSNIPECFRKPLMKVAYKLLSRDEATFEELTPTEQQLLNSFETDQIYRLLTGEPDTVPKSRFNWFTVTGGDATIEFILDQAQPLQTGTTSARPSPATATTPRAKVKMPKASTSTRAVLPSSSSSSSNPSTMPSSPTASTLGTAPKALQPRSTSGSSATPSKSPSPTTTPKPAATSAKGSGRKLRAHPEVNYRDLHLGQNLLLGRREFLKMPLHSEICWKGCPTNCRKSLKSGQRISGHLPTLIFLIYGLLKMSTGTTVPGPELMNAQNFDFAKPKLIFRNISRYVATCSYATTFTYIHIRIPFNFTTVSIPNKPLQKFTANYLISTRNLSSQSPNQSRMSA